MPNDALMSHCGAEVQTFAAMLRGISQLVKMRAIVGSDDKKVNQLLQYFMLDLSMMGIVFSRFSTRHLLQHMAAGSEPGPFRS